MGQFQIKIAGHVATVTHLFDSTRHYCAAYLTQEPADISICVTPEDLEAEQALLLAEALREKIRPRVFAEPFLERSVIQRKLAEALLPFDILLLHGSAVAVNGEGYLFTADCGTGKSTHTRFWREVFGSQAVMVNDDKPFLKLTEDEVFLCGAPWSGKHGLDTNITVPLKGICILRRGAENRIWRISPEEGLGHLRKQSEHPESPLTERLSRAVPLWQMECRKDVSAAKTAYAAMSQHRV